ncbi:MAG: SDR family NAD(P)-dependent oxidoreductase [Candidatus Peregrinibacteria bacterium]
MKILVTGSSGTIGTRLCERLLKNHHDVVSVDWEHNRWSREIDALTIHSDLRNEETFRKIPRDIEMIIHLAANARVYELVEHPDRARDNILTLFNVLEFARKNAIQRFLFASSRETYGNAGRESYTEDLVRIEHCESPYAASKLAGEALTQSYRTCYGIDHIIFRFSNVYGMYDVSERVVPLFIRLAKKNEPLVIFGKEKCLDFTYIDDAVDGILLATDKFEEVKNETYNLAFGKGETISRLAELIKGNMSSSSPIVFQESRTGEVAIYTADTTKARLRLGFAPSVTLEEGMRKSVEWYGKRSTSA